MEIFKYILILLSCSVILVVVCRRLQLPAIIGYLTVGMVVGPGGLGWLPTIEDMNHLAEFGIVFLMFTLGLEFSIPHLIANKKLLFIGGIQVIVCTIVASSIGLFIGLNITQSILISGGLALSSTAVVVKQLTEQKQQFKPYGSIAIKILLFQDLAAVFFLIIVPALSGVHHYSPLHITFLLTIIKGLFAFISMTLLSIWVLRPLFHEVAKARSTELFMLATLLVALSAAGVTYYLGLSMALGAFLAGLMLGETEFRHQIELDIRPFRDVLLGLFFIVIGANLDLSLLSKIWIQVLLLLLALVILKFIIIAIIVKAFRQLSWKGCLRTGLILAHGGEFSFVILTEAMHLDLIPSHMRPIIFSAVVISVISAPLCIRYSEQIINLFIRTKTKDSNYKYNLLSDHAAELKNHIILCGYGRVGQILGRFLDQEKIPWIALDMDPIRLSKSTIAGEYAFYGDATYPNTLISASLSHARMIVITFSDENSALNVIKHVRAMRLDIPLFVRTKDDTNLNAFQDAGATEVVPETLESSLMLASHLLLTLGVPTKKIFNKIREIHSDRYQILRGMYRGEDEPSMLEDETASRRSLYSIFVPEGSNAINQPLSSLASYDKEFYIKSITRENKRIYNFKSDMCIKKGDVIVLFATPEEHLNIEEKILNGEF